MVVEAPAAAAAATGSPMSRPAQSPLQEGASPLLMAAIGGSGSSPHAGDELMDLLFDTPSVVGDEKRLQRILTHFGVSSEAGHVVATRSSPASAVIAAMQHHAGGSSGAVGGAGSSGAGSTHHVAGLLNGSSSDRSPGPPPGVGREPVTNAISVRDAGARSSTVLPGSSAPPPPVSSVPAPPLLVTAQAATSVGHAFAPHIPHMQPVVPGSSPSTGADILARSVLQPPAASSAIGSDHSSTLTVLRAGAEQSTGASSLGETSSAGDSSGKCLGCALADLRRVDTILSTSVDFWTSMELVIDVAVRRKEHSETLLMHASSRRALSKATHSLQDYMAFWQAFHFLCGRYAEALQGADLYAWLNLPEAEELQLLASGGADHSHGGTEQLVALQAPVGMWGRPLQ
jgi:hypothetical protein